MIPTIQKSATVAGGGRRRRRKQVIPKKNKQNSLVSNYLTDIIQSVIQLELRKNVANYNNNNNNDNDDDDK